MLCNTHQLLSALADEHYLPTLLAWLGLANETDCYGWLTHVDFSHGGYHPKTYEPQEVNTTL